MMDDIVPGIRQPLWQYNLQLGLERKRATVNRINKEMLNSPHDKKFTKSTIYNAIVRGNFGVSPLKTGRQGLIPPELTHGLACHSVMMQASREGEASSLKMRAISSAITLGTQFENKFSTIFGGRQGWITLV
jgi:hypothetical protein